MAVRPGQCRLCDKSWSGSSSVLASSRPFLATACTFSRRRVGVCTCGVIVDVETLVSDVAGKSEEQSSDVEILRSCPSEKNEDQDADNVDAKNDEDGKEVGDGEPAVNDATSDKLPKGRWRKDSEDEEEVGSVVGFCDKRQRLG